MTTDSGAAWRSEIMRRLGLNPLHYLYRLYKSGHLKGFLPDADPMAILRNVCGTEESALESAAVFVGLPTSAKEYEIEYARRADEWEPPRPLDMRHIQTWLDTAEQYGEEVQDYETWQGGRLAPYFGNQPSKLTEELPAPTVTDYDHLNDQITTHPLKWLRELFPEGHVSDDGEEFCIATPAGGEGDSFRVNIIGEAVGLGWWLDCPADGWAARVSYSPFDIAGFALRTEPGKQLPPRPLDWFQSIFSQPEPQPDRTSAQPHAGSQPSFESLRAEIKAMPKGEMLAPDALENFAERITQARLNDLEYNTVAQALKAQTKTTLGTLKTAMEMVASRSPQICVPGSVVIPQAAREMADRYIFIKENGQLFDRKTRKFYAVADVCRAHRSKMPLNKFDSHMDPADFLFGAVPCAVVDGVTFFPGEPEITHEGAERCLNTWTPPTLEPMAGDHSPFTDHVNYIFDGNEEAAGVMLDWLACAVTHPGVKIRFAPLIIGKQGIGKNLIFDSVLHAIGPKNFQLVDKTMLDSDFNGYLKSTALAVVPELRIGDRIDIMNKLKPWISDNDLTINEKNIRTFHMPNRVNWLLFSNYTDATVIDDSDRKFFIHISKAEPKPQDYYDKYYNWLDAGGYAVVYNHLKDRDLSKFKPNGRAPMTESKKFVIENGKADWWRFLQELYAGEMPPFSESFIGTVHAIEYLKDKYKRTYTVKQISDFFGAVDGINLGQMRVGGGRPTVWAIRKGAEEVRRIMAAGEKIGDAYLKGRYCYPGTHALVEGGVLAD